jgi:hypothetical protein
MVWKNQDHGPASKTAVFEISIPGYLGDIGSGLLLECSPSNP